MGRNMLPAEECTRATLTHWLTLLLSDTAVGTVDQSIAAHIYDVVEEKESSILLRTQTCSSSEQRNKKNRLLNTD